MGWLRSRSTGIRRTQLACETLEERLNLSWASVPPATLKPPASAAAIVQNQFGDANGVDGIDANEVDWYQFIAISSGAAIFKATTPGSDLNTVLAVYNSSGARMGLSDNISATNTDSQVTVNLVKGQQYWFGVSNLNNTPGGSYSWSLNGIGPLKVPNDDLYENNDTRATAANLGTITAERSFNKLVMLDGNDWYRFTLSKPAAVDSSATIYFQDALGNLNLELYNSNGGLIGFSNNGGDSESISMDGLGAGTYYVRVIGFDGAINPEYSLVLTPQVAQGAPGFTIQLRMTGLTLQQQATFNQAAARWQQIITSDLPNVNYNGLNVDDLLIEASSTPIDGVDGILGQAAPDSFRSGSFLPYHGFMEFDTADLASLQASGQLYSVILHEMGHVLGIGTLWERLGLLFGAGTSNPIFVGQNAKAEYNQIFNTNASGVPVENGGGQGTRDSHWRESILKNELMTGYLDNGSNPLSRITVASLADLGYTVNINRADNYVAPTTSSVVDSTFSSTSSSTLRMTLIQLATATTKTTNTPQATFNTQGFSTASVLAGIIQPATTHPTDAVFTSVASRSAVVRNTSLANELLANLLSTKL